MKNSLIVACAILAFVGGFLVYRTRNNGWMVTELFTRVYSDWNSIRCGHATNSPNHGPGPTAETVITCSQTALANHRAFSVMFTAYGTDDEISNALVVHKSGQAEEIFYASGTVENGKRLVRHTCDSPTHLVIETDSPVGFPRLHCAEWPPKDLH